MGNVGPYLKKEDICFGVIVPVQEKVAMSLHQLGNDDGLQNIGDLYEVHKSILTKIIKEFCRVIRNCFHPVFVQIPSLS